MTATVREIADDFAKLCKEGNFEEAGAAYWAPGVRSIEAMDGPMAVAEGIEAVVAKGEWWNGAHEVHSSETHGPYVNGDGFALRFVMDVTEKASGNRMQMDEVALYTVAGGKIVEERFFY
jgi:SnoaL-like domain